MNLIKNATLIVVPIIAFGVPCHGVKKGFWCEGRACIKKYTDGRYQQQGAPPVPSANMGYSAQRVVPFNKQQSHVVHPPTTNVKNNDEPPRGAW